MATASEIAAVITEIEQEASSVLSVVSALDPAAAVPIQVAETLAVLFAKALTAWSAAAGVPITVESVRALLPNAAPLSDPTV